MGQVRALVLALAVLLFAQSQPIPAQKPRFVAIDSAVRARLAEEWDDDNRYQRERAYCLMVTVEAGVIFDTWRVHSITRAPEPRATPNAVVPACPETTQVVIHTHPPGWCHDVEGNDCQFGGDRAYQCQPSPQDRAFLRASKRTLDLIQCGPHQFVPTFRDGEGFY